ncbi:hypothetical protein P6F26_09415 [Roseibacterium sp. SDUM158017]|uniref:hypothetical protein n=1 Tax=Roseicyclus salinarum TaxID=3036773 RepID=UPI0024150AC8|nr:hypothetical protein [Roseibacterium sp. SDUM158017]MDG4648665.1 hypothetical protein [Roseibacterium sp. SDUM158017]
MNERRIATLELLSRLERSGFRTIARRHASLIGEIAAKRAEAKALADRIATETDVTSAETAPYVGAFISAIRAEIDRCDAARRGLEREAAALEGEMQDRFRSLKTAECAMAKEILAARDAERMAAERERFEAMMLGRRARARAV